MFARSALIPTQLSSEHFVHPGLHLFLAEVFDFLGKDPLVTERVRQPTRSVSVELIRNRDDYRCPSVGGLSGNRISICDFEIQSDRCPSERSRTWIAKVRIFVGQHDCGRTDLDFGVDHLANGVCEPRPNLTSVKGFLVKRRSLVCNSKQKDMDSGTCFCCPDVLCPTSPKPYESDFRQRHLENSTARRPFA